MYRLIQTCSFKDSYTPKKSWDENLHNDYMGSSEFEFGALNKSMKRVVASLDDYKVIILEDVTNHKGDTLRIYAKDIPNGWLDKLRINLENDYKPSTQEMTQLRRNKLGEASGSSMVDVWWDIKQDIFFCFGKIRMKKVKTTLQNTKKKMDAKDKELSGV